ncbi:glycosyltransferase family 87 protein [Nocardiopsis trehalosi]|uniref:glycosyltransferase family 87 protein n=1 Tax=Nocardiopsis trehalosi TaxID=109329 RepID=UPI00082E6655|nr:glycosyltransferase 87 family protein [Nocardiopsis trehalosi]
MTTPSGSPGHPRAGDVPVAGTRRLPGLPSSTWAPLTALAAVGAVLGYLVKAPCRFGGGWVDGTQYAAACYSDVYPLYFRDGLDHGVVPYLDRPIEYPVLTGALMHLLGRAVAWLPDPTARAYAYFDLTAVAMGACLAAVVLCAGHLAGRGGLRPAPGRPFDRRAALLAGGFTALTPPAFLAAYINWDLLAVALLMGGLVCYGHGRQWAAGALIGLATAAKFYPFLVFGPLLVLVLRTWWRREEDGHTWGDLLRPLGGAAAAWAAVNLPVLLAAPEGWATFFRFSSERGADWGSVYYLLGAFGLVDTYDVHVVNTAGTVSLAVACAGIGLLTLLARRRPPLEQLAFLVVAAFLLTNKVWSPQFVLWLLPLAAVAWPRRAPVWAGAAAFAFWQLAETVYFFGIWQHLQHFTLLAEGTAGGLALPGYAAVSLGRSAGVAAVAGVVAADLLRRGESRA